MNPLLISGFGTSINVEKRKLIIQNKLKNQRLEFYPHKIDHDSIILDGHSGTITFDSMRWLMKHGINLTLLNWNGRLLGITLPESPVSGKLRIKQYQKYLDYKTRYKIAEKIVKNKIESSINLLEKIPEKRRRGQRGADKKPRRFNPNSLQNLKPFRTKLSNSRTATTNLSNSGSGTTNWTSVVGIGLIVAVPIVLAWMLYKPKQKEELVLGKKVLEHTV